MPREPRNARMADEPVGHLTRRNPSARAPRHRLPATVICGSVRA